MRGGLRRLETKRPPSIMDGVETTLLPNPAKLAQRSNLTEPTMNNQFMRRPDVISKPAISLKPKPPPLNPKPTFTHLDAGPLSGGSANLMIGSGMSAPLLKEFIDLSYRGNTSIAPAGYSIDAPLSDSRVKVYAKNGSNDKDVVVTHRGSVGIDDWMDNASYMFRGKTKGTKTYNLHRDRHKRAVDKYGAKNIIAIGHSRAGLYLQELQKEFPIKENITYNKASGFHDIGRLNATNQTDVRVGNDVVSLLAPLQRRPNKIVNIDGTKNPFDFNAAHQTSEINKVGDQFIGKQEGSGRPERGLIAKFKNIILNEDDTIISKVLTLMDINDKRLYSPVHRADGLKRLLTSNTGRSKNHYRGHTPYTNEGYYRHFKVAEFMPIYDNLKSASDKVNNAFAEKYKNKDVIFVKKYKPNVYFHQYTSNSTMFKESDAYILKDGEVSILGYIKLREGEDWRDGMKSYDYILQGYDDVKPNVRFSLQDTDDEKDKVLTKWNKLQDKRQNKKVGGMYQLGNRLANRLLGIQHPTYYGPHQQPAINVDDVFETDIASPAYQRETLGYQEAKREEAEAIRKARADMLATLASVRSRSGTTGSGTLPVISSVEGIKRLIATEQARLRKIKKGYSYESPTMTKEKLEEKVARLKERLKSAKKSKEGHADVSYFIPKSIKWLKIMASETRVGSDAYNRLLLEAIKKLLAELSGKKQTPATKKKTATLEEDRDKLEKLLEKPKTNKKGYSKKTADANKPAPVIIPPSSLTNERASIRAAVNREKTYNKIIDDKQQEDFKVILRAMGPDPPQAQADEPQQTKEELRKERAREAARRQRARDKPSGFEQAQEYNRATRQRQAKAKQYGIPTREYSASLKRSAQIERELEKETDEEKKKVIREERNKLRAKYTYLDEIMNSDNTEANRASAPDPPKVVESEVEPPLAGDGMCGGSMCGGGYKYIITPKTEEYNLLF